MSKKNLVVGSDLALFGGPGSPLQLDASIGMADIVAIRLAEVEKQLNKQEEDTRTDIKANNDAIEAAHKLIKSIGKGEAEAAYKKALDAAAKVLAGLSGDTPVVSCEAGWQITDIKQTPTELDLQGFISMGSGCSQCLQFTKKVKAPASFIKAFQGLIDLNETSTQLNERMVNIRLGLSRIPGYERQVRADIARLKLENTDNGPELLARIDAIVLTGMPKALPSK